MSAALARRQWTAGATAGTLMALADTVGAVAWVHSRARGLSPALEATCRDHAGWAELLRSTETIPSTHFASPGLEIKNLGCHFTSGGRSIVIGTDPHGAVVTGKALFTRVSGGAYEHAFAAMELTLPSGHRSFEIVDSPDDYWAEKAPGRNLIRPPEERAGHVEFFVVHAGWHRLARCRAELATGDTACVDVEPPSP